MDRTRTVTIICWAISALSFLGLIVWIFTSSVFNIGFGGLSGFGVSDGFGRFEPIATHSVPADNIDSMRIDWTSGAVIVRAHSGDSIQITEFAQRQVREDEQLSLSLDGGTLTIHFTQHRVLRTNMPSKQLEVLIPYALSESFESFNVNTVSGRIDVSNVQANDFTAGTTSGRIELRGIASPTINASTTSGRIEVFDTQAEEIHLRTTSGRIETTRTQAAKIYMRTTSGRIEAASTQAQSLSTHTMSGRHELSGAFGRVNTRSTSGRIEITSSIVPEHLAAHATSGRISVTVPNEGPVSVQYSTSSGRFTSTIPIITHAGADAQFSLSTSSGRISLFEFTR